MEKYITQYESNFDEFCDDNKECIDVIDLENLKLKVMHFTSNMDECSEIKTNGIINLQRVLSEKTALCAFLANYGVKFDIENKILITENKKIDINYDKYLGRFDLSQEEEQIRKLSRKIYSDYQINGFFAIKEVNQIAAEVYRRPEFMQNLTEVIPSLKRLESKWIEKSKSYIITLLAEINQFQWFSFYDSEVVYDNDKEQKLQLKKWLINNAIDCIINCSSSSSGIIAYMNFNATISPNQIIMCKEIIV